MLLCEDRNAILPSIIYVPVAWYGRFETLVAMPCRKR